MKLPNPLLAVILTTAVLIAGCDNFDANAPHELPQQVVHTANDAPFSESFSKLGAADVTVGANVSVWDSGFDNPDPSDGIAAIGGTGQINGEFTIAERDGIQIALRAQDRFTGPIEASGNRIGRYHAATGQTGNPNDNLATWNYDWHVDLRGTGTTLSDYELTLHLTSVANEVFGQQNPIDLTFDSPSFDGVTLYQQSWNPGFGNNTFDPAAEETYTLRLRLRPKSGGPDLSVATQVRVSSAV